MEHDYKWRFPAFFTFDEDPKDKHTNSQLKSSKRTPGCKGVRHEENSP